MGENLQLSTEGDIGDHFQFSPRGTYLVNSGADGVYILVASTGRVMHVLQGHRGKSLRCTAFSPDETRLATSTINEVKIWDTESGQEILTLPMNDSPEIAEERAKKNVWITAMAWTSDGTRLRASLTNGSVLQWDGTPIAKPSVDGTR
jgi:WD40 repeat protein